MIHLFVYFRYTHAAFEFSRCREVPYHEFYAYYVPGAVRRWGTRPPGRRLHLGCSFCSTLCVPIAGGELAPPRTLRCAEFRQRNRGTSAPEPAHLTILDFRPRDRDTSVPGPAHLTILYRQMSVVYRWVQHGLCSTAGDHTEKVHLSDDCGRVHLVAEQTLHLQRRARVPSVPSCRTVVLGEKSRGCRGDHADPPSSSCLVHPRLIGCLSHRSSRYRRNRCHRCASWARCSCRPGHHTHRNLRNCCPLSPRII